MTAKENPSPTAGLVVIGNEILSGKIQDSNSPFLCRELRFLGVDVQRIVTIPDERELIARSVREFSEAFTWVFTSGGIGPTHDDITVEAIAEGFGVQAVIHPRLEEALRTHYQGRLTEDHLRMAMLPEGSELVEVPGLAYPQILFRKYLLGMGTLGEQFVPILDIDRVLTEDGVLEELASEDGEQTQPEVDDSDSASAETSDRPAESA